MTTGESAPPTVVDAHHHLWDLDRFDYPWMPPGENVLRKTYLPEHLALHLKRTGADKTVVVQAQHSVEEAGWLLDLAEANDFMAGVVAWVDLTSRNVGDVLDGLLQRPGLVGIRHLVHDEPDDRWLLRDDVIRGLRELARRGLAYDLLLRPQHLQYVAPLAEEVPDLRMVVDHIAKPLISAGTMEPWATDIAAVAALPSVYCKVSGMVTEAEMANWTVEDLKPYMAHVIEHFGFDRLMFGSDWPVCLLAGTYEQVFEATLAAAGSISDDDRAALMGGNATAFYRL